MTFQVNNNNNIIHPKSDPVFKSQPQTSTPAANAVKPATINTASSSQVAGRPAHPGPASAISFPTGARGATTRDTLINALKKSDLAPAYNDPSKRPEIERIADLCIRVGQRENVEPKLLFAIAMQESDCGTNKRSRGAAGAMGILPGALRAVQQANGSGLEGATLATLRTDDEKCITVSARYLKVAAGEAEGRIRGNSGVSAADLQPGNLNRDTWKILSSYRFGATDALSTNGAVLKHYEPDFQSYLKLLNVNIV